MLSLLWQGRWKRISQVPATAECWETSILYQAVAWQEWWYACCHDNSIYIISPRNSPSGRQLFLESTTIMYFWCHVPTNLCWFNQRLRTRPNQEFIMFPEDIESELGEIKVWATSHGFTFSKGYGLICDSTLCGGCTLEYVLKPNRHCMSFNDVVKLTLPSF